MIRANLGKWENILEYHTGIVGRGVMCVMNSTLNRHCNYTSTMSE